MSSPAPDEDTIARYIQSLSELKQDTSQALTQGDLEHLALEVGLGSDLIEKARQAAQDKLNLGIRHLKNKHWDQAIAVLDQSLALNPLDAETAYQLAFAHHHRYQLSRHDPDRQQAIELLQRCLAQDPGHALAPDLLATAQHPLPKRQWHPLKLLGWVTVGLVVVPVIMVGLVLAIWRAFQPQSPPAEVGQPTPSGEPGSVSPSLPLITAPPTGDVELPLILADAITEAGMTLASSRSRLSNYETGSFYNLQALLTNQSQQEWQQVTLLAELLDQRGEVLTRQTIGGVASHQPVVRPGDLVPLAQTISTSPEAVSVRLSLQTLDGIPAAPAYDPGQAVAVEWAINQPAHWQIEVRERQLSVRPHRVRIRTESEAPQEFVDATFTVTNTGGGSLQRLKLEARLYNEAGQILETRDLRVVSPNTPAMPAQETRLVRVLATMPAGFHRYHIVVTEAG